MIWRTECLTSARLIVTRSNAGLAVLALLGALGSSCGEAKTDAPGPITTSAGTGGSAGAGGAAGTGGSAPMTPSVPAPDAGLGDGCPAPRHDPRVTCSARALWARHPSSGACCAYASHCEVPESWARFATESECQSSCRCAEITPSDFSGVETDNTVVFGTEHISLECGCSAYSCPSTLTAALDAACAEPSADIQPTLVRGCGRVALRYFGGYTGSDAVFDEATGALIGQSWFSDVSEPPCNTYSTIAGQGFDCESATECDPCVGDAGAAASGLPTCE